GGTVPALARGRVADGLHGGLGLLARRDLREHDTERAAIEHRLDQLGARRRYPYDRRHGRAAGGRDHGGHRLDADGRVLRVDHEPVDAGAREGLDNLRTRRRDEIAEGSAALRDARSQRAERPHRSAHRRSMISTQFGFLPIGYSFSLVSWPLD